MIKPSFHSTQTYVYMYVCMYTGALSDISDNSEAALFLDSKLSEFLIKVSQTSAWAIPAELSAGNFDEINNSNSRQNQNQSGNNPPMTPFTPHFGGKNQSRIGNISGFKGLQPSPLTPLKNNQNNSTTRVSHESEGSESRSSPNRKNLSCLIGLLRRRADDTKLMVCSIYITLIILIILIILITCIYFYVCICRLERVLYRLWRVC